MIGTPQNTSAQAKGGASRSPRSETAPSAPIRPPAPIAAVRYPTPVAPLWSTWYAVTTISTFRHPRTNVCVAMRPTRSRARGTSRIALKPSQTSTAAALAGARTRPGTDTRATRAADTRRRRRAGGEDRRDVGAVRPAPRRRADRGGCRDSRSSRSPRSRRSAPSPFAPEMAGARREPAGTASSRHRPPTPRRRR